jgi:hypothetical protein
MVNPGHASKSCMTCKLRKIQCDLAHPLCRHCSKSGRVCLGYGERQTSYSAISATDRQIFLSSSSNIAKQNDTSRHIEASAVAISCLENLLMGISERSPQEQGVKNMPISAISTIGRCLYSLRQTEQTFQNRRALLADYNNATSELRATLTVSPCSPALASVASLFSIYEVS